jgi:hypothetical protein
MQNAKPKPRLINTARIARDYLARGWKPVPIPWRQKTPKLPQWQLRQHPIGTFGYWQNIGLQFGSVSNGLCDVDLDCDAARALAPYFLPDTAAVFGRPSSPASHWLYISDAWQQATEAANGFDDPVGVSGEHGARLVELRTGRLDKAGKIIGALSLCPVSMHPSSEWVDWERDGEPAKVDGNQLLIAVSTLAAACLLVRHYPPTGKQHKIALVVGGWLARAGWDADRIAHLVEAVAKVANDNEWQDRVKTAKGAVGGLQEHKDIPGEPRMRQEFGDPIVDTLAEWLDITTSRSANRANTGSSKPAEELDIVTVGDVPMRPITWVWEQRLARGKVSIVAGDSFLGKSHISIDTAARITTGARWPDGGDAPAGKVLILATEDSVHDTLRPRLEAAGGDVNRVKVIKAVTKVSDKSRRTFSLKTDLIKLEAELAGNDYVLIVVDPISSYLGDNMDGNSMTLVRPVLERLADFADQHNVAVLAIHHPPKSHGGDALKAFSGSYAFIAAPRFGFIVAADVADPERRLFLSCGSNIGKGAAGLGYRINEVALTREIKTSVLIWDDEPVTITAAEALRDAGNDPHGKMSEAIEFLTERLTEPRDSDELIKEAKEHDISVRTLKRAKKHLKIQSVKHGFTGGWDWVMPGATQPRKRRRGPR